MSRGLIAAVTAAALVIAAGAAAQRSPSSIGSIDHVVVIYQENWSFDSLLGRFPGANGIANASATSIAQTKKDGTPYTTLPPSIDTRRQPPGPDPRIPPNLPVAPFDLGPYVPPTSMTGNPIHRFYQEQHQIDGGRMDRFVAWSNVGGLVMSYYDATSMPLGRLAKEFVLADNFFHAAFGGSFLNHMWMVCACTPSWPGAPADLRAQLDANGTLVKDGDVTPDGYVVNTAYTVNTPHPARAVRDHLLPSLTLPTIGDRLDEKGVAWAWYSGGWDDALAGKPHPRFAFHHQPFAYFARWADGSAAKARHLKDETQFFRDVAAGRLPAVSFVKPLGTMNEHPNSSELLAGQQHMASIVQAVRASPAWARTVIIITYDENGGRWDHVAPPVVDRWGPGTRVPTVIVSPLVRHGHVDHTRYDTTAILKLIETRWGLAPLGARDAAQDGLSGVF
ncbi:MAG TPA: alkaline phosphatase family protein [Methylomirabilota bacterium]|nr:alkaline phosphatase family protein [Methylomirabilota bacterium]